MPTANSVHIYSTSGIDRWGLTDMAYVLLDGVTETPMAEEERMKSLSGTCFRVLMTDRRLRMDLSGDVKFRAGIANAGPGSVVPAAWLTNFTGPAGPEDHYGYATDDTAGMWIIGAASYSPGRGTLHRFSCSLNLEFTATLPNILDSTGQPVVDNYTPPSGGSYAYNTLNMGKTIIEEVYYAFMIDGGVPVSSNPIDPADYFVAWSNGQNVACFRQTWDPAAPESTDTISGGSVDVSTGSGVWFLVLYTEP